jgi:hypothetical protein
MKMNMDGKFILTKLETLSKEELIELIRKDTPQTQMEIANML